MMHDTGVTGREPMFCASVICVRVFTTDGGVIWGFSGWCFVVSDVCVMFVVAGQPSISSGDDVVGIGAPDEGLRLDGIVLGDDPYRDSPAPLNPLGANLPLCQKLYNGTLMQELTFSQGRRDGMRDSLKAGVELHRTLSVDRDRTIGFMGEGGRVYATPELVRDIEHTCRDLILEHADAGEDSVGTEVAIRHLAPTPMGLEVTITATVAEVDRSKVVFDITASDPVDRICKGRHERFVVDVDKTVQRLAAKSAKAAS